MWARLAGELATWPSKETMAGILRAAGLTVTVGRYSVRVEGPARFKFQQYGGDLGDPVIDAGAERADELLATARILSDALARAGIVHRFEVYDADDELAGYLNHEWPLQANG